MNNVTISLETSVGITMVSNRFIDEYMKDANDAQIKIYLYLLRMAGTGMSCGVSDIADHFNHTEKDVMRSLKYWDKLHVISLLFDEEKKLSGIRLLDLCSEAKSITVVDHSFPVKAPEKASEKLPEKPVEKSAPVSGKFEPDVTPEFDKNSITLDQLKAFKNREETAQLLFIVEQYLAKPLSASDVRSIFFMTDILHFSSDLIDYLVQYCVGREKRDFRYMDKVAISWAEAGITTPKQASSYARKYDKNVYTIMNALGKSNSPTAKEADFISRWVKELGFTLDVILVACERTVLATDKHRFEYTDSILQSWYNNSVHSVKDIKAADEAFQKRKAQTPAKQQNVSHNQFNQFKQNQYDYEDLLEKIKVN